MTFFTRKPEPPPKPTTPAPPLKWVHEGAKPEGFVRVRGDETHITNQRDIAVEDFKNRFKQALQKPIEIPTFPDVKKILDEFAEVLNEHVGEPIFVVTEASPSLSKKNHFDKTVKSSKKLVLWISVNPMAPEQGDIVLPKTNESRYIVHLSCASNDLRVVPCNSIAEVAKTLEEYLADPYLRVLLNDKDYWERI